MTTRFARLLFLTASSTAAVALIGWVRVTGAQSQTFHVEEATIADIQSALVAKRITTVDLVNLYLARIKAYNGNCVNMPEGLLGPMTMSGFSPSEAHSHLSAPVLLG